MSPNFLIRDILLLLIFTAFFITVNALIRYDLIYPPNPSYNTETKWK